MSPHLPMSPHCPHVPPLSPCPPTSLCPTIVPNVPSPPHVPHCPYVPPVSLCPPNVPISPQLPMSHHCPHIPVVSPCPPGIPVSPPVRMSPQCPYVPPLSLCPPGISMSPHVPMSPHLPMSPQCPHVLSPPYITQCPHVPPVFSSPCPLTFPYPPMSSCPLTSLCPLSVPMSPHLPMSPQCPYVPLVSPYPLTSPCPTIVPNVPSPPRVPTVSLAVLTHTPTLHGHAGSPIHLHCAFAAPPSPFVLEWRHQSRGAGQVLLAYDSTSARAPRATPGAELLLGTRDGDGVTAVTLRLARPSPGDEGTYICSVFLPHGHAQTVLQLSVFAPPKVILSPKNLVVTPGMSAELRCHVSGFYPLDVTVTWQRRAEKSRPSRSTGGSVMDSWTSSHRRAADGTYSRTAAARLVPAHPQHHGDVYSCVVTHGALDKPIRVSVRLLLAGTEGPHLEDITGLFLVAFILCGLIRWLYPKAARPEEETKKSQ
uniref:TAP binding protein n=1 Tax=Coturnix japonica TaxID=93934 RepID=A0A8C2TYQ6_COTJA